ncbi:MAG TPA: protease pro-enzyme activation domain-containing protein [Stellaceae bacterium]|nr:protease pro-enzyme activation domain-containing protein [Stellaceae bacterium]
MMLRTAATALSVSLIALAGSGALANDSKSSAPAFAKAQKPAWTEHFNTIGEASSQQVTRFDIYLPLTHEGELNKLYNDQLDETSPRFHQWLTPAQFTERFGPSREALDKTEKLVRAAGLTVVKEFSQGITVEGRVGQVNTFLSVRLYQLAGEHGNMRLATPQAVRLPKEISDLGGAVYSFEDRTPKHVNSMVRVPRQEKPLQRNGAFGAGFYFDDLKQAYAYPAISVENGTGVTIGLLMSSAANQSDLDLLMSGENFVTAQSGTSIPSPQFTMESVDGASTTFSSSNSAAAEASLDTQMSLGSAPGAAGLLYVIPDLSGAEILKGYQQIVMDNTVDVQSSSFGGGELFDTAPYNGGTSQTSYDKQLNKLLKQGNVQGQTFLASSGDEGATACQDLASFTAANNSDGTFIPCVETPASYPNITGVGGTNLETINSIDTSTNTLTLDSIYDYELALGDPLIAFPYFSFVNSTDGGNMSGGTWGSGGGHSVIFAKPGYQTAVVTGSPMRTVPDISMHMGGCPGGIAGECQAGDSYVITVIAGGYYGLIGTSASSPEFAGAVALLVQKNGRQGNVNKYIYALAAAQTAAGGVHAPDKKQFYHRFIPGFNGKYKSKQGEYSEVLGVGTPQVANFLKLPQGTALAGTPQSPSNP